MGSSLATSVAAGAGTPDSPVFPSAPAGDSEIVSLLAPPSSFTAVALSLLVESVRRRYVSPVGCGLEEEVEEAEAFRCSCTGADAGVSGRGLSRTDSGDDARGKAPNSSACWRRAARSSGTMFFTGSVPALPGLRGPMGRRVTEAGGERARWMSMVVVSGS